MSYVTLTFMHVIHSFLSFYIKYSQHIYVVYFGMQRQKYELSKIESGAHLKSLKGFYILL